MTMTKIELGIELSHHKIMDEFLIQVGRYKGAYKTRHVLKGENQAILWFNAINIGNGYKKRLLKNGKVIARVIS